MLPHSIIRRRSSSSSTSSSNVNLPLSFLLALLCSTSSVVLSEWSGDGNNRANEPLSKFNADVNDDAQGSSPTFSVEDADYIRHLLSLVFDIQRTAVGAIFTGQQDDNEINRLSIPDALADFVDHVRSLDADTIAEVILAKDEELSALMASLVELEKEYSVLSKDIAGGDIHKSHQFSTSQFVKLNITFPWEPLPNLTDCSKDYSQFVDPITNRIWNIVRSKICVEAPTLCILNIVPPVPLPQQTRWGRAMIDAMGKIPEGIREGKLHFVGAYDLCLSFEDIEYNYTYSGEYEIFEPRKFNGQYCRLNLVPSFEQLSALNLTLPLQLGVCNPDTCSRQDVINYITKDNKMLALILRAVLRNATIPSVYCGMELDASTDIALQACVGILLGIVILYIIATVYDGCFRKRRLTNYLRSVSKKNQQLENKDESSAYANNMKIMSHQSSVSSTTAFASVSTKGGVDRCDSTVSMLNSYDVVEETGKLKLIHRLEIFLLGFSAYTNLRKIFSTRSKPDDIPVLNGVRYMTYAWVILGQTYLFGPIYHESFVTGNTWTMLLTYPREFKMQVVINFHLTGDTFLLISGILVTYWFLKRFEASGRQLKVITILIYLFRRYWRAMPAIALTVMFYTTTYRYLAEGPLFPADIGDGDNCRLNWWVDVLMVQNLVRTEYLCLTWLFLVPIIVQLQIFSIIVLVPLVLKPKIGYVMIGLMWIAHIITTAIISSELRSNTDIADIATGYLFTPWCRAGPFVVGMALGIILHKNKEVKMPLVVALVGWIVALGTMAACVFSSYSQFKEGGKLWSDAAHTAYDTLARSAWGVAVAWVVFACHYGYGGVIATFLSWKLFVPLSRLVFASLLTHAMMIFRWVYTNRQLMYIEQYHMLYLIIGNLVYTLFMGIVFGLLFHYPMSLGIERALLSRTRTDWLRAGRHPRFLKCEIAVVDKPATTSSVMTSVTTVDNTSDNQTEMKKSMSVSDIPITNL